MPSSYSTSFRLNYQAPGDNLNVWGTTLNTGVFQLLEDALAGVVTQTPVGRAHPHQRQRRDGSGPVSGPEHHRRDRGHDHGSWASRSSTSSATRPRGRLSSPPARLRLTAAGEVGFCYCRMGRTSSDLHHHQLRRRDADQPRRALGQHRRGDHGLRVDATAFAMAAGSLPAQTGNAGKALITNGTASWGILIADDIRHHHDYASDQAAKTATATHSLRLRGFL